MLKGFSPLLPKRPISIGFTVELHLRYCHLNSHLCCNRMWIASRLVLLMLPCRLAQLPLKSSWALVTQMWIPSTHLMHPLRGGTMLDSCLFSWRLSSDLLLSMLTGWGNINAELACGCRRNRRWGREGQQEPLSYNQTYPFCIQISALQPYFTFTTLPESKSLILELPKK